MFVMYAVYSGVLIVCYTKPRLRIRSRSIDFTVNDFSILILNIKRFKNDNWLLCVTGHQLPGVSDSNPNRFECLGYKLSIRPAGVIYVLWSPPTSALADFLVVACYLPR